MEMSAAKSGGLVSEISSCLILKDSMTKKEVTLDAYLSQEQLDMEFQCH